MGRKQLLVVVQVVVALCMGSTYIPYTHAHVRPRVWPPPQEHLLDVHKCAQESPEISPKDVAIVMTNNLAPASITGAKNTIKSAKFMQDTGVDLIMIIPYEGAPSGRPADKQGRPDKRQTIRGLKPEERAMLAQNKVIIHEVPWAKPPVVASPNVEFCIVSQMLKLHVMNLTKYKAVLYLDTDATILGDMMPMLRCAATGKFLVTVGLSSPMNFGMFAIRPFEPMVDASLWYLSKSSFEKRTGMHGGWDDAGTSPWGGTFPGFGCDQGFIWTFFLGNGMALNTNRSTFDSPSPLANEARKKFNVDINPRLVSRCIWNYQRENGNPRNRHKMCPSHFRCSQVKVVHKGHHYREVMTRPERTKIMPATYDAQPKRHGVCGCGKRTWKDGWVGGVCSQETWEDILHGSKAGGTSTGDKPSNSSAGAGAGVKPGESKVHAELRRLLEGLSVLQDKVVKDVKQVEVEHEEMEQVLDEHRNVSHRRRNASNSQASPDGPS